MEPRECKERRPRKPAPKPGKAAPPVAQSSTHKKGAKTRPRFSPDRQAAFLAALEANGSLRGAAQAVRLSLRSHYTWLEEDPTYPPRFSRSRRIATDTLIEEARRRAVEGDADLVLFEGKEVMVPVRDHKGDPVKDAKGNVVMTPVVKRRRSDNLLMFMIKAGDPTYRDATRIDVHPSGGGAPQGDVGLGERLLDAPIDGDE